MKSPVLLLALGGTALILFGSFVAIVAPGDGQTGFVTWTAWFFGGIAGLIAVVLPFVSREARSQWPLVVGLAALALLSVAWSVYASYAYGRDRQKRHAAAGSERKHGGRP